MKVTDATATGQPFIAAATATGVNNRSLTAPTIQYYLASDTALASPLSSAPTSASVSFTINKAASKIAVSAPGGTYNGSLIAASTTLTGVGGPAPRLDGVSPTLTYYNGSSATGTPPSGPPIAAGN